jgi:hypothetical protein
MKTEKREVDLSGCSASAEPGQNGFVVTQVKPRNRFIEKFPDDNSIAFRSSNTEVGPVCQNDNIDI